MQYRQLRIGVSGYSGVFFMINKILVYLDEEDIKAWEKVLELHTLFKDDKNQYFQYKDAHIQFWKDRIDKYGILRDKPIYIDIDKKVILYK